MRKMIGLLKGSHLGILVIGLLCAVVLVSTMPQEAAAATIIDYPLLAILLSIAAIAITSTGPQSPTALNVLLSHLETAVEGARLANLAGDQHAELSRLSKAIGATEALMGMTSSCDTCGDLRSILQQVIGLAANMKTSVVGASGTCHPNGLIQPNEQCDPLAVPTGCPINTIELTFCNDECLCRPVP
jgi:hypothetical protein